MEVVEGGLLRGGGAVAVLLLRQLLTWRYRRVVQHPVAGAAKGEAAGDADGADGFQPVGILHHRQHPLLLLQPLLVVFSWRRQLLLTLLLLLMLPLLPPGELFCESQVVYDIQHDLLLPLTQRQLAAGQPFRQAGPLRGEVSTILAVGNVVQQRCQLRQMLVPLLQRIVRVVRLLLGLLAQACPTATGRARCRHGATTPPRRHTHRQPLVRPQPQGHLSHAVHMPPIVAGVVAGYSLTHECLGDQHARGVVDYSHWIGPLNSTQIDCDPSRMLPVPDLDALKQPCCAHHSRHL